MQTYLQTKIYPTVKGLAVLLNNVAYLEDLEEGFRCMHACAALATFLTEDMGLTCKLSLATGQFGNGFNPKKAVIASCVEVKYDNGWYQVNPANAFQTSTQTKQLDKMTNQWLAQTEDWISTAYKSFTVPQQYPHYWEHVINHDTGYSAALVDRYLKQYRNNYAGVL